MTCVTKYTIYSLSQNHHLCNVIALNKLTFIVKIVRLASNISYLWNINSNIFNF